MKLLIFLLLITIIINQSITINVGCKQYSKDTNICLTCSNRFFKDAKGICQPVSNSCNTYSSQTGACKSCFGGFILVEVICILDPRPTDPRPTDPNCANFSNGVCQKCSKGFYIQNNTCVEVDPLCKTFNYTSSLCSQCYQGFTLQNNTCIIKQNIDIVGCAVYNNSVCAKCSKNYYMNSKGVCTMVDALCKTFDNKNGDCLSCYDGRTLANGICVIIQDPKKIDVNCAKFENQSCVKCSNGFYFNKNKVCTEIDPFCKKFNNQTLSCTGCYSGFSLVNGSCILNIEQPYSDVYCKIFDSNGKCLNCSKGYYFDSNKVCKQLDSNCKSYDQTKYICSDCYSGYSLVNSSCIQDPSNTIQEGGCAQWLAGVCMKCANRAYYDINNNCVLASDLCKTFNQFNGFCTSCYNGYALESKTGVCSASPNAVCAEADSKNVCKKCIKGYYLDQTSQCRAIDIQCQTFNFTTLKCEQCYKGFTLNTANICEVIPVFTASIPSCVNYDPTGKTCLECYDRFYLSNNECIQADAFCKNFDKTNGDCLSCYSGFTLSKGKCIYS